MSDDSFYKNRIGGGFASDGFKARTGAPFEISDVLSAPDFAGIQRYEWSADLLSLTDGDPVATWADDGTAGVDVSQATAGKQPVYRANVGGFPAVEFDGVNDEMEAASNALDFTSGCTVFYVGRKSSRSPEQCAFNLVNGADNIFEISVFDGASGVGRPMLASNFYSDYTYSWTNGHRGTLSEDFMHSGRIETNTDGTHWWNRIIHKDGAPNGTNFLPVLLGKPRFGNWRGFGGRWEGYIRGIVVYDGALSDSQVEGVWDNLESRFGGPF